MPQRRAASTEPTASVFIDDQQDPAADDDPFVTLQLLFKADHKDVVLFAFYSAVLKLFAASGQDSDPTRCSQAEHIVDWLTLGIVLFVFGVRHFLIIHTRRPLWLRLGRCVLLVVFLLITHSQPIACALPSNHLSTLSYVQGAIMLVLALAATQVLAQSALQLRRLAPTVPSNGDAASATVHGNRSNLQTDNGM